MRTKIIISIFSVIIFITQFSSSSAKTWQELMDSTKFYQDKQDFQTALIWSKLALSHAENEFGKNDSNYVLTIGSVSVLFYYLANLDSAIYYGDICMKVSRILFKGDNPNVASIIDNMGCFYDNKGKYNQAEQLYKEALDIRRRLYKTDHPNLAKSLNNMAYFYDNQGDYKQAEPLYKEALEMRRRLFKEDNPDLAISINNMAYFYDNRGDYKQAEPLYKEALEMSRRIYKTDNPDLASSIDNLAHCYIVQGKYSEAEPLIKEAFDMNRRIFKTDNNDLANSINSMAHFYFSQGDYKQAEPLYLEALDIRRRLFKTDNTDLALSINNLAVLYDDMGNFNRAGTLYQESYAMYRRLYKTDNSNLVLTLNNLASFYKRQGDYAKEEELLKEALEMNKRLYKTDHPDLAKSINRMAVSFKEKGDSVKAEPLYKEALEMYRRIFKTDHPELAMSINNIGVFYTDLGNYTKAEPFLKESLEMRKRLYKPNHPSLALCITNMALFYVAQGKYSQAEPFFKEAVDVYKNMLNNYFPSLSENEKKLFWNTLSDHFEAFNSFAVSRSLENPSIICNMYDMQLYTKALLLNSTSKIKKRILNANDSALIDKYKEWTDKRELLVKLYSMTEQSRKSNGYNTDSVEKITNELEKEMSLQSEIYSQSYEKKKVTWKLIQGLLKPDEAAVEVIRLRYKDKNRFTDTIYYAFLIITDLSEEHPDIIIIENGKQLENEYYNDYRNFIKNKEMDNKSFDKYWKKLYEKLIAYKKIYFSADGIYNKLNPETLMLPNGQYLIDIQDIQQVNSTKDLLMGYYRTKQESNIYNSAILIGNPNFALSEDSVREANKKSRSVKEEDKSIEQYENTRGFELTRLPGTEKEIKDIEKFLKSKKWDVNSYLGDMALKTTIKKVNSPRVLHIATHGLFLEDVKRDKKGTFGFEEKKMVENPLLRSGLFFTGADNYLKSNHDNPTGEENGILTAYEAMNLDLDKTELVVLSACETGLGDIQNGEGVFGLRRAFQQAGAKTVVMSLWRVNDVATQELMSLFYKNWITGMTKREAFSKAKQEVKAKYKDPYFWGAFVMVGE